MFLEVLCLEKKLENARDAGKSMKSNGRAIKILSVNVARRGIGAIISKKRASLCIFFWKNDDET